MYWSSLTQPENNQPEEKKGKKKRKKKRKKREKKRTLPQVGLAGVHRGQSAN